MGKVKHVAVNTRFLLKSGLEGIGRYTYEILQRLVKDHPDVQFSFFFDREYDPNFIFGDNVTPYVMFPPARHPVLFKWWFHGKVTRKLAQIQPDVFYSPDGFLSLDTEVPQVAVFHDLAFMHFPEDVKKSEAQFYHKYFPQYARKAKKIIAVSNFTKQDIIAQFGITESKIHVVHNGCSTNFQPIPEGRKEAIRKRFTGGEKFFHFVGAIQPRKNLDRLITAYGEFREKTGSTWKLVLVGRKAWNFDKVIHSYQKSPFKDDIIFSGFVDDVTLNALYSASEALCYVPYFEGFGFPVLESMHAGTPVISSNATSIPEVAGDAAILVDPLFIEEISAAMSRIFENEELRSDLINKGNLRKNTFSWERSAEMTWEIIESAV